MKLINSTRYINIDEYAATPKYIQLTNSILSAIESGYANKDDLLPSICDISNELDISKDTVEKAYGKLKKIGVLGSVPGKGFYIMNTDFRQKSKVCLLFSNLNPYKKMIYDAFMTHVGKDVVADMCSYNDDFNQFKTLLASKMDQYSHFVVMPYFNECPEHICEVINTIPKHKLIMLSKMLPGITGSYAAVYEDFEDDIFNALIAAGKELSKYHTIKLLFPNNNCYPKEIIRGFSRFCQQYSFDYALVSKIEAEPIREGEVYINLADDDLIRLIERIKALNLTIGEQVGIISYNEAPIKKIILNGVTTLSADFSEMGRLAAGLIMGKSREHKRVPFQLTLRSTI